MFLLLLLNPIIILRLILSSIFIAIYLSPLYFLQVLSFVLLALISLNIKGVEESQFFFKAKNVYMMCYKCVMIEPLNELQQRRSVAFNKKRRVVLFEIANHIFSKTCAFKDYLVDIAN